MAKGKRIEKIALTVRTPIGSKGYGYLHEHANSRRYFLHANRVREDGFSATDITATSTLVVDVRQQKTKAWIVTKIHTIQ